MRQKGRENYAQNREQRIAAVKEYARANVDKIKEHGREYRKRNREKLNERARIYNSQHREQARERNRRFRERHPERGKEQAAAFRDRNPERRKEIARNYYWRHREEILAKTRQQYREDPEHFKQIKRESRRRNPGPMRAAALNRYAKKKASGGKFTSADVQAQYKRQKGRCYWCDQPVGDTYHVDHVFPINRGGSNGPDNLVIACPGCNQRKSDKMPWEWSGNGGKMF